MMNFDLQMKIDIGRSYAVGGKGLIHDFLPIFICCTFNEQNLLSNGFKRFHKNLRLYILHYDRSSF